MDIIFQFPTDHFLFSSATNNHSCLSAIRLHTLIPFKYHLTPHIYLLKRLLPVSRLYYIYWTKYIVIAILIAFYEYLRYNYKRIALKHAKWINPHKTQSGFRAFDYFAKTKKCEKKLFKIVHPQKFAFHLHSCPIGKNFKQKRIKATFCSISPFYSPMLLLSEKMFGWLHH